MIISTKLLIKWKPVSVSVPHFTHSSLSPSWWFHKEMCFCVCVVASPFIHAVICFFPISLPSHSFTTPSVLHWACCSFTAFLRNDCHHGSSVVLVVWARILNSSRYNKAFYLHRQYVPVALSAWKDGHGLVWWVLALPLNYFSEIIILVTFESSILCVLFQQIQWTCHAHHCRSNSILKWVNLTNDSVNLYN